VQPLQQICGAHFLSWSRKIVLACISYSAVQLYTVIKKSILAADITKVVRVIDTTIFGVESIIVIRCLKSVISMVKIANLSTKYT